jgi:hypothetical protein
VLLAPLPAPELVWIAPLPPEEHPAMAPAENINAATMGASWKRFLWGCMALSLVEDGKRGSL